MREEVEGVLNDPKLATYVAHRQEQIITTLAAKTQIGDVQRSIKRRGERRATHAAPDLDDADISALDQRFELDPLRIFQYACASGEFVCIAHSFSGWTETRPASWCLSGYTTRTLWRLW